MLRQGRNPAAATALSVGLIFLVIGLANAPAFGHFLLNLNVRILHVEHLADGLNVYLRTPMPYLVADRVGPEGDDGLPEPAPYTQNRWEDERVVHYLDFDAFAADPLGLGRLASEGLTLSAGGESLPLTVTAVRVHPIGTQPGFATLDEAKAVLDGVASYRGEPEPRYVGDIVVDILLQARPGSPVRAYSVSSRLDPGLPDQDQTANVILDHGPGGTQVFRARGLLTTPIEISRSRWAAARTFVTEGVRHILEGLDHLLFVVCLALGAARLNSLVWRATGFTLGHSVTLAVGFFGYIPKGAWFVPFVETGIALSIIYAAAVAVRPTADLRAREYRYFLVTVLIGLLHGLGFSFVLHEILQVNSPDIWQSLLAFNVGVELGQLLIILVAWPLFRGVERLSTRGWRVSQIGLATVCGGLALYWAAERGQALIQAI